MTKIRIIRRRGLGATSCKSIKNFSKYNIDIVRNDNPIPDDSDIVVRWGCTNTIKSKKHINKAKAIHFVNDKYNSRKSFQEKGVSVPTLYNIDQNNIEYPVIVRPHRHSQGKNIFLANNNVELFEIIRRMNTPYYISKYIEKEREFGVFMFDGRISSVIEKVAKKDDANKSIAWNVAQGTHKFVNVKWSEWPIEACIESLKAFNLTGLDFGRVDVMVKNDKPYILEVNSAHSLTSPYRQEVFTKCLDYFIENGYVKNDINFNNVKTYKSIIHPVLRVNSSGLNL